MLPLDGPEFLNNHGRLFWYGKVTRTRVGPSAPDQVHARATA